ncbi:hypothetical protein ACIRU8_39475 [Streptomyces sp. NPDC101175]|uniref:hypothetical protein n=1 Tax=Streptomyces sp. NPDC101175 TaxID=3366123 RepID=UPI003834DB21
MTKLHIPADDFQLGDLVHLADGRMVEIRAIERGDKGLIVVNPGAPDRLEGRVWERVTITRKEAT